MTQKEIYKFLANTKVYVNGKSKEIQEKLFSFGFLWIGHNRVSCTEKPFLYFSERKEITCGNDMKFFTEHEYREITAEQILALEVTEPTYRPFKDVEECWNEMLKHKPFGWIKQKDMQYYVSITAIDNKYEFAKTFKYYTFVDGIPFGIKEE